jgi:hypothetical protein
MRDDRGSWYLFTGLFIGVALGLLYAWVLTPLERDSTSPASLRQDYKDQYRAMVAAAFMANGDVVRARARLSLLGDADAYVALAEQAQRSLAVGNPPEEARALGLLAVAIRQPGEPTVTDMLPSPAGSDEATAIPVTPTNAPATAEAPLQVLASPTQPSSAPPSPTLPPAEPAAAPTQPAAPVALQATQGTVTFTPTPIGTLTPTPTPTRTPGAPFVLEGRQLACQPAWPQPVIQVQAYDAAGNAVSGLQVVITWDGGEERFYTGLKQEISPGYADFQMSQGVAYTLRVGEGGEVVGDLSAQTCETGDASQVWGAWQLVFKQP